MSATANHDFVVTCKSLQNAIYASESRDSPGALKGQEEVNVSAPNFCQIKLKPDSDEAQQPELSPHLPFIRMKTNQ